MDMITPTLGDHGGDHGYDHTEEEPIKLSYKSVWKGMFVGKYNNKDHVLFYMIQTCNYVNKEYVCSMILVTSRQPGLWSLTIKTDQTDQVSDHFF